MWRMLMAPTPSSRQVRTRCRDRSWSGHVVVSLDGLEAVLQPVAGAIDGDDLAVVGETVEDGGSEEPSSMRAALSFSGLPTALLARHPLQGGARRPSAAALATGRRSFFITEAAFRSCMRGLPVAAAAVWWGHCVVTLASSDFGAWSLVRRGRLSLVNAGRLELPVLSFPRFAVNCLTHVRFQTRPRDGGAVPLTGHLWGPGSLT